MKRTSSKVWAIIVVTFVLVTIGSMSRVMADNGTANAPQHMVTIYDEGVEQTIITRESTLRLALVQANIQVNASDIVEPGLDQQLVADHYNVNVYRARPVIVEDGQTRIKTITAAQSPTKIVRAADITLYPEDKTEMARVNDVVSDGGAGLKLTIDRATPFSFVLYGKRLDNTRTQSTTIGEMLKEKKVKLGPNDGTSLPLTTPLVAGMTVEVWRNGVQTTTEEQDIAMPTEQVNDQDRDIGFKEVRTVGKVGKKQVTFEINTQNGKEVSRKLIQEVQTLAPVKQVEVIGAKSTLPSGSHDDWMAAAGIAPSDYGYVNYIVMREGGWEPCKVQGGAIDCSYTGSMGYGIVQATPGIKMASSGGDWRTNPITQLKWATGYASGRYGSWKGAYDHWLSSHNW